MEKTVGNSRNVDALARLIELYGAGDDMSWGWCKELATDLASRGVLVPSALTNEDLQRIVQTGTDGDGVWDYTNSPDVRDEMERIAKGED